MKTQRKFTIGKIYPVLISVFLFSGVASALENTMSAESQIKSTNNVIEIKITKTAGDNVEAKITNLSKEAKKLNFDDTSIIGRKLPVEKAANGSATTEIIWEKIKLKENKTDLTTPFKSKILGDVEIGDNFKAKGDQKVLVDAFDKLSVSNTPPAAKNIVKKKSSSGGTGADASMSSSMGGSNSSRLSTLSSLKQNPDNITSAVTGEEATSTTGCTARVDYQLNKVFVQERTTLNGKEVQACRDSKTSYALQRSYEICPKVIDTTAKKIITNFQYFYFDDKDGTSVIDYCQADKTKDAALEITKSYECNDHVDLLTKIAYSRFKQFYKDIDGKDVLFSDCATDVTKSYPIREDYASCSVRHLFDQGYSVPQSRLFYVKDDKEVVLQGCQDTSQKYVHATTSDTCTPVISNNQVTTFSRKYITVDGVRQYISDCTPLNSNVTIKSENCTTTPYTHDFVVGQSFQNKNYYYMDGSTRVNVSSCVKSEEMFVHTQDSSVCNEQNDDVNFQTTIFSKKLITVNGNKVYISECAATGNPVPYKEIGYKWSQEFSSPAASLSAGGISDNLYLGSRHGEETTSGRIEVNIKYITEVLKFFDISKYSSTGKCDNFSSLSYNGNNVDLAYSDRASVVVSNTVDTKLSTTPCYNYIVNFSSPSSTIQRHCTWIKYPAAPAFIRDETQNYLYYQRCQNYRCTIYKFVKKPILQRKNGSEIVNSTKILDSKYTCGGTALNNTTVYY
jgi:hypothetical protein